MGEADDIIKVKNLVSKIAPENGYKNYSLDIIPLVQKGEGYTGKIFFVTVKSGEEKDDFNIVVKLSLTDLDTRKRFHVSDLYENEIYFYGTIFPLFDKFQMERSVENGFRELVQYYGSICSDNFEVLAVQNVKKIGYEMFDKKKLFDGEHFEVLFKAYAKFHAISYAYQDQNDEEFKNLVEKIHVVVGDTSTSNFFKFVFAESLRTLEPVVKELGDENIFKAFKSIFENIDNNTELFGHYNGKYGAILHGDAWSNNMIFKYENMGDYKKPVDVKLLDWQMINFHSPVKDLSYSFYTSGSKELYKDLDKYLKIYHDQLSTSIKQLGSNPDDLFSYEDLKREWKQYGKFGFLMSIIVNKFKLMYEENIMELQELSTIQDDSSAMSKFHEGYDKLEYQSRFRDLILHINEIDAL